jgi:hypothetical protein
MTEKCASPRWAWPITLDSYDRNPELNAEEAEKLRANAPSLADGVPPSIVIEKCSLPRLMKPLEDVSTHIELHRKYWPNLKILMVRDMAARGKSFWSWTEQEWIESIKKGGHEKPSVAAVACSLEGAGASKDHLRSGDACGVPTASKSPSAGRSAGEVGPGGELLARKCPI